MSETDPIERRMLGAADKDYNSECADELREGADEITKLKSQLEEAQKERDELKSRFLSLSEFKAKYLEGRQNPVEEARAKAIEECARIAEAQGWPVKSASYGEYGDGFTDALNDASKLIATNIRALNGSVK